MKKDILILSIDEIKQILSENNIPTYVAGQIYDFLHKKLIFSFDEFKKRKQENY